jgi:guanylate kinase
VPRLVEFDQMVLADAFVEWAHVHGHRYGTSKKAIEDRIAHGADVILEIDWQGALQIKRIFTNAILIFILPPSWEELRSRLERRGEDSAGRDRNPTGRTRPNELAQCEGIRLRYNQRVI